MAIPHGPAVPLSPVRPQAPSVAYATDSEGRSIVRVPMSNQPGQFATVEREDFEYLESIGVRLPWYLNANCKGGLSYVRTLVSGIAGNNLNVARLLLRADKNHVVTYRDGNRLNLTRGNLRMRKQGVTRAQSTKPSASKHPKA